MLSDRRAAPSGSATPTGRWVVPVLSVLFVPLWASGFIVGKIATGHMQVPTVCVRSGSRSCVWRVVAVSARLVPLFSAWALAVPRCSAVCQFSLVYPLSHGFPAVCPA